MAGLSIRIDADAYNKWLKEAPEIVASALKNVIQKVSFLVEREAKINVSGKFVNVQTGRLRASIATEIIPFKATVRTNTNYARFLHEGTRYIRARPFMEDAAEQVQGKVDSIVKSELRKL